MKNFIFFCLAICLIGVASCSKKDNASSFNLDESFTLGYNATAQLDNKPDVKIQFVQVTEDSRCPTDVQCVWAGRIVVNVTFFQNGTEQTGALALGDITGTSYSDEFIFGDYTVKLLGVQPAPKSDQSLSLTDYKIEVLVKKSK